MAYTKLSDYQKQLNKDRRAILLMLQKTLKDPKFPLHWSLNYQHNFLAPKLVETTYRATLEWRKIMRIKKHD